MVQESWLHLISHPACHLFIFLHLHSAPLEFSLKTLFWCFDLRIPGRATDERRAAITHAWRKWGGEVRLGRVADKRRMVWAGGGRSPEEENLFLLRIDKLLLFSPFLFFLFLSLPVCFHVCTLPSDHSQSRRVFRGRGKNGQTGGPFALKKTNQELVEEQVLFDRVKRTLTFTWMHLLFL